MPKKHHPRALLTKPQSSTPHTLTRSVTKPSQSESSERTVNDLIRESRRLQIRGEQRSPPPSNNAASLPPSLRAVLDLPAPPVPAPRLGTQSNGPSRLRRVPGPPPPRSWLGLADSIHAPAALRPAISVDEDNRRVQVRTSNLPDATFPAPTSLQHFVLKKIASNWEWHAQNDLDYLGVLPTNLRETLLSYIAAYNDVPVNPVRALFLYETEAEDRAEVRRLDLSNGLGLWATFKQLERDLLVRQLPPTAKPEPSSLSRVEASSPFTPESWDADQDSDDVIGTTINPIPKTIHNFRNLKHLSLAVSPSNIKAVSWSSLLSLATELRTLTSLSLAYWPQPTFTPNAASTRAVVKTTGSAPVVYGGSDMYTPYDNNWREAAGILRTLSRSLYCLTWLDLTGCGRWFAALEWSPSPSSSLSSSPEGSPPPPRDKLEPEWNGGWRGLEHLILQVGWRPIPPSLDDRPARPDEPAWNVENERKVYRYNKERELFMEIRETAQNVARYLRARRKEASGRWIEVDCGEDLAE